MTLICFPLEGGRRSTLRQVDAVAFDGENAQTEESVPSELMRNDTSTLKIAEQNLVFRSGSSCEVAESSKYDLFNRASCHERKSNMAVIGRIAAWQILHIPM